MLRRVYSGACRVTFFRKSSLVTLQTLARHSTLLFASNAAQRSGPRWRSSRRRGDPICVQRFSPVEAAVPTHTHTHSRPWADFLAFFFVAPALLTKTRLCGPLLRISVTLWTRVAYCLLSDNETRPTVVCYILPRCCDASRLQLELQQKR